MYIVRPVKRSDLDQLYALAKLAKKHKEGTVAILVPEPLTSLLHCMLLHETVGGLWRVDSEESPPWELIEMPAEVVSP